MAISQAEPASYGSALLAVFTARDTVGLVQTAEIVRRRIAVLIEERGVKKNRFAKAAKRPPSWVSAFLGGTRPFPFERIDEIAKFFQLETDRLIAPLTDEERRASSALDLLRRSDASATTRMRKGGR